MNERTSKAMTVLVATVLTLAFILTGWFLFGTLVAIASAMMFGVVVTDTASALGMVITSLLWLCIRNRVADAVNRLFQKKQVE